jgi:hypothetical protein
MTQFGVEVGHRLLGPLVIVEIAFEALQRDAQYIAVMQTRSKAALAEAQPYAMEALHIFRPEARRMRAQVNEKRRLLGGQNLEGEGMARFG